MRDGDLNFPETLRVEDVVRLYFASKERSVCLSIAARARLAVFSLFGFLFPASTGRTRTRYSSGKISAPKWSGFFFFFSAFLQTRVSRQSQLFLERRDEGLG